MAESDWVMWIRYVFEPQLGNAAVEGIGNRELANYVYGAASLGMKILFTLAPSKRMAYTQLKVPTTSSPFHS